MRTKLNPLPQEGDRRVKAKFLWLPKTINGEWRWLEWAAYEQRYAVLEADGSCSFWKNFRWVGESACTDRTVPHDYDCDCGICGFCNGLIKRDPPPLTPKTAVIVELEEQALMFREMALKQKDPEASTVLYGCGTLLLKQAKAIETDECRLAALCEPKYPEAK